jgi:hypothetical protein
MMDDWENGDDGVNPFDKAAFDTAQQDEDGDLEGLPAPSFDEVLDVEAERAHQRKLDRIIADQKISADDPLRHERARQRKTLIDAENKFKAAVGYTPKDFKPPDPTVPDYATPRASTRPIVVAASRFGVKKLKAAATAKAAEEEAEIERQLAEARARVRAKKKADRASLNVDFKK